MKRLTLIVMGTGLLNLALAGLSRGEPVMVDPAKPPSARTGLKRASSEVIPRQAGANLLINGSFERGGNRLFNIGSTEIEGWKVVRGSVDIVGPDWQSSDGSYCLDLEGEAAFGGVSQTFATTPGQSYLVRFDMAGNPEGPPKTKKMRIQAVGQSADFSIDIVGRDRRNVGWQTHSWRFTATEPKTTIEFFSLGTVGGDYGPLLDNVSVLPNALSDATSGDNVATVLTMQGERFIGNVISIEGGKLRLTGPQFEGEVRILVSALNRVSPLSQTVKSDGPDRVQLTNGDYLGGKIKAVTEDSLVLESQAAGTLNVPRKLVSSIGFSGRQAKGAPKAQAEIHVVRFANNDMVSATSISVADGVLVAETIYGQLRCQVGKVAHIVLASKGQEKPRRRSGDVTIQTAGSRFTIQFAELSGEFLSGQSDHLGSVKVKRGAIKELVFNVYSK